MVALTVASTAWNTCQTPDTHRAVAGRQPLTRARALPTGATPALHIRSYGEGNVYFYNPRPTRAPTPAHHARARAHHAHARNATDLSSNYG